MDTLGAFAHDAHADMFAGKRVQVSGIETYAVIADDQLRAAAQETRKQTTASAQQIVAKIELYKSVHT